MNSYSKSNANKVKGLVLTASLIGCIAGCSKSDEIMLPAHSHDAGVNLGVNFDAGVNSGINSGIEKIVGAERPSGKDDSYLRDFSDNYEAKINEVYVERPLSSKYHLLFNGSKVDVLRSGDFVAGRALDVEKGKHRVSTDSADISIKTIKFHSWEYNPDKCKNAIDGSCWHYIKSVDVKNDRFEFKINDYGTYKLDIDIAKDETKEEGKRYLIIDAKPQKTAENKAGETKIIIEKVKKEKHSLKKALKDDKKKGKGTQRVNMPNHRIRFSYSR